MYDLSHPFCLRNLFVFFTIGRDLELSDPTYRLDRNFPVKSLPSTHPAFSDGKLSSLKGSLFFTDSHHCTLLYKLAKKYTPM